MASSSSSNYLLKQHVILRFLFVITISISHVNGCFTSIFSFGDSYSDTGNLLHIPPSGTTKITHCAFPPYGRTFFHHPTGRCSDGRVVIDFLAKELGLPFLPPYFGGDEKGRSQNFQKGVNFAVSGATALDSAFLEERGVHGQYTNVSLGDEVGFFKDALPSLCSSSSDCKELLRTSLIVMGVIGGNDYIHALRQGKSYKEVRGWVPLVVDSIASAIGELIEYGAVTVLVPGLGPLGCLGGYLTLFQTSDTKQYDPLTGCLRWVNEFGEYHNDMLQKELDRIRKLHPHVNIVYADYHNAAMRFYTSPKKFGYTETLKACCGMGGGPYNYNSSMTCGESLVRTCCNDPSSFVSWDGVHYTEVTYRLLLDFIFPSLNNLCPQTIAPWSIDRVLDS